MSDHLDPRAHATCALSHSCMMGGHVSVQEEGKKKKNCPKYVHVLKTNAVVCLNS